ncbi:hypothetical protein BRC87_03435 [Halobacteriales archaeon QS_4_66_20]|nr:MAG: hypothetical protein BRC87_03435 [Halobacteriales archaeon QS_4_66_20]
MELSRRDAVAALAALGLGGGAAATYTRRDGGDDSDPQSGTEDEEIDVSDGRVERVAVAAAEVLYPSQVTGVEQFVTEFLGPRLNQDGHGDGIREAVGIVEDRAQRWHGAEFDALDPDRRDQLLREMGVDTADEAPDGTDAERVRYYLVNDLLLALYASPTGGELVGVENPQGHPGGTDSYQRGPP